MMRIPLTLVEAYVVSKRFNMTISIVINADTRDGFDQDTSSTNGLFSGCKSVDFLYEGVINKINFWRGFNTEVIVYIDVHNPLNEELLDDLSEICDTLVIRRHTSETNFNDYNYLRSLYMASGDIICHVDQDTMCFAREAQSPQELIDMLETNKFVSYPSPWTPRAVHDESFGKRTWASTRFFICKKEALKFKELENCIKEPEWGYAKYGDSPRRCNWLEHFLSLVNEDSVFYPPPSPNYTIFSWGNYKVGTIPILNSMNFEQVNDFVNNNGGIVYPNDLYLR